MFETFMIYLGYTTFGFGMCLTAWFFMYRAIEERWPDFIFGFTKKMRLERKRRRLKEKLDYMTHSAPVYKAIAELEEQIADVALDNPRGYLND